MKALVLLLLILLAVPAGGQVGGVVVDGADRPVADARVQLWAGPAELAEVETDGAGRFRFGAAPAEGRTMLSVRRLGFRPLAVEVAPGDTALVLRLEVRPLALAPVRVASAGRRLCPNREDPAARALWEAMRSRYRRPGAASVRLFAFMEARSGVGEKADAFRADAGRMRPGWTEGSPVTEPPWMERSGYATPANGGAGERTASWDYRALDQGAIQDFTGDHFGSAHLLSVAGSSAEGTVVAFCPRGRMGNTGQVLGTLVIGPDRALRSAAWSFRTPRPDEDAGGEASYFPPDPALGSALLTREGVFWRRTNGGRYYFEARSYSGWRLREEGDRRENAAGMAPRGAPISRP